MGLILGLIFGALIGAGIVYILLKGAIAQRDQEIQQQKRTLNDLEQSHESRLQDTVQSLQADYQHQVDQKSAAVSQQYETQIQSLKQQVATLKAASTQPQSAPSKAERQSPAREAVSLSSSTSTSAQPQVPSTGAEKSVTSTPSSPSQQKTPKDEPSAAAVAPAASAYKSAPASLSIEQRQDLVNSVLTMGDSGSTSHLQELKRLSMFPASEVREAATTAIHAITDANPGNPVAQQVVPVLGKLSQDPDPTVRCAAISALRDIPSYKVIPFMRRSLRDSDMRVVKAANDAMSRFKYYRGASSKPTKPKKKNFRASY